MFSDLHSKETLSSSEVSRIKQKLIQAELNDIHGHLVEITDQ